MPTGTMNAQAFREWLLESGSSTGPDVGKIAKENVRATLRAALTEALFVQITA